MSINVSKIYSMSFGEKDFGEKVEQRIGGVR